MTLTFHPFFTPLNQHHQLHYIPQFNSIQQHNNLQAQTVIISLIDLKPQHLPIPFRQFIVQNPKLNNNSQHCNFLNSQSKPTEEDKIYSNTQSMLWLSQPIVIENVNWINSNQCLLKDIETHRSHAHFRKDHCYQSQQLYVRYMYLPPLSEYMKHYGQQLKFFNAQSNSNTQNPLNSINSSHNNTHNTHSSHSNIQLNHQTQLVLEQRHQIMYCLARQLSSSIVYEFGSKYIRFDHLSFKDYQTSVFDRFKLQNQHQTNSSNNPPKGSQNSHLKNNDHQRFPLKNNKDIPYYVVIKSSSYSAQRDYELYKVKLSVNDNKPSNSYSFSSNIQQQHCSSLNVSMQIESKSIMGIMKVTNVEGAQRDKDQMMRELMEMSDKLVKLTQNRVVFEQEKEFSQNQSLSSRMSERSMSEMNELEKRVISGCQLKEFQQIGSEQNQQSHESRLFVSKESAKHLKVIEFQWFLNILGYFSQSSSYQRSKSRTTSISSISKETIDRSIQYYSFSIDLIQKWEKSNQKLKEVSQVQSAQVQGQESKGAKDVLREILGMGGQRQINEAVSFEVFESIQAFIVNYFTQYFSINESNQINHNHYSCISQLLQRGNLPSSHYLILKELQTNINQFVKVNFIRFMKNQYSKILLSQSQSIPKSHTHQKNTTQHQNFPINTTIPILDIQLPTQLNSNHLSSKIYSVLSSKLSHYTSISHFSQYLPLIFSYPLQIQHLHTIIAQKSSQIHSLHQQIAILELNLKQKHSTIQEQQFLIQKFKLDQLFYQQVLNDLNQLQAKLTSQEDTKRKLMIDLQCSQILNLQANQVIQTQKIKQARLLEEKQNFLQAISHLSKENLHFITLSKELQTTIDSLNHKISHYQMIDLQINSLTLQNHQLQQQNTSIKHWKSTIEQEHKQLLEKEVQKFNYVLKTNFLKFKQQKKHAHQLQNQLKQLIDQLQSQTKNSALLEQQINFLKSKYFHGNILAEDLPCSNLYQPQLTPSMTGTSALHLNPCTQ